MADWAILRLKFAVTQSRKIEDAQLAGQPSFSMLRGSVLPY
jgi:hypothetical protein